MKEDVKKNREWYLFDAEGKTLGRLSTEIANVLRGKGKVSFRENLDMGDYAVVINAEKVALTGKKEDQKVYYKHTGYLGNMKETALSKMRLTKPSFIINHAVMGMLPKNTLRQQFISRLKVYSGDKHPHQNIKFKNEIKND